MLITLVNNDNVEVWSDNSSNWSLETDELCYDEDIGESILDYLSRARLILHGPQGFNRKVKIIQIEPHIYVDGMTAWFDSIKYISKMLYQPESYPRSYDANGEFYRNMSSRISSRMSSEDSKNHVIEVYVPHSNSIHSIYVLLEELTD